MAANKPDLYLKNAWIVTENAEFEGGIVVEGETIKRIVQGAEDLEVQETVDLDGKIILPGLIDSHVHFNEPGRTVWEGYHTGSMAAAAGGITTFLEMPLNSIPETLSKKDLQIKRKAVESKTVVDYGHWGGLVDNNLDALEGLQEGGVIGFKAFLSDSGIESFPRIDDDLIYAGLKKVKALENVLAFHAENEYVTRYLGEQLREAGRTDGAAWTESRPPCAELEAVQRACYWAGVTGGTLHIVHVTIADGIQAVNQAKAEGIKVTAETCPHYLSLTRDDFEEIGPAAKCAPPLRSPEEVDKLWQQVLDGKVDTIGSDHSPCTWEEKAAGMDDIWQAWGGISGIQTMLPVILTEGVHKRHLKLSRVAQMMSSNPARIFGLYPRKGSLQPGSDADLTVVDLDREWTVSGTDLWYQNPFSAFEGYSLKGRVTHTFVRGRLVYQEDEIKVQPGYGRLVRRS